MQDLTEKIRMKLNMCGNIKAIQRATDVSRHSINKIIRGEKVPAYIIVALNEYFKKFGE